MEQYKPQFVTVFRPLRYEFKDEAHVVEPGGYHYVIRSAEENDGTEVWVLHRDTLEGDGQTIPIGSVETFMKVGALAQET